MSIDANRPVGVAETDDVSALVLAARAGDPQAWNALVERFGRLVFATCVGYRLSQSDAADVSQTVWLRLAEHLHRIEHPERVGGWLVTTARRECLALLRARTRFEPLATEATLTDPHPEPIEVVTRAESITEVAVAFARLTERCRELLRRVVCDPDASYLVIASEMAMPIGSIGPTRSRCLAKLRRYLEEGWDA